MTTLGLASRGVAEDRSQCSCNLNRAQIVASERDRTRKREFLSYL